MGRKFFRIRLFASLELEWRFRVMNPKLAPQSNTVPQPCKHLRVQIVSRDEDAEFVECKECGEIFESSEFKDMSIEERTRDEF